MLFALAMNDSEVVLLELLQPSGQLSLRLFEVVEPLQGPMIGAEGKMAPQEVWTEVFGENHSRKQFLAGGAISPFWFAESATGICNDMFLTICK